MLTSINPSRTGCYNPKTKTDKKPKLVKTLPVGQVQPL